MQRIPPARPPMYELLADPGSTRPHCRRHPRRSVERRLEHGAMGFVGVPLISLVISPIRAAAAINAADPRPDGYGVAMDIARHLRPHHARHHAARLLGRHPPGSTLGDGPWQRQQAESSAVDDALPGPSQCWTRRRPSRSGLAWSCSASPQHHTSASAAQVRVGHRRDVAGAHLAVARRRPERRGGAHPGRPIGCSAVC